MGASARRYHPEDLPTMTMSTWTTGSGLISFNLKVPQTARPATALAHATSVVLENARIIGSLAAASLSTLSAGEDAIVWNVGSIEAVEIVKMVQEHEDSARVELTFDLRCTGHNGEFVIARGLDCWIERGPLSEPDADVPLELTISLDTDVYSAMTWGQERDNRSLSMMNAPLFNRFLSAVRNGTHASVGAVHA